MIAFRFANMWFLIGLPIVTIWALYFLTRKKNKASLMFSGTHLFKNVPQGMRVRLARVVPPLLRWLALCLCVLCLARPQTVVTKEWFESTGVEFVMSLDTSGSMRIIDADALQSNRTMNPFATQQSIKDCKQAPHRMNIVKSVVQGFIKKRKGDRMSVIVFGSQARPLIPLTHDLASVSSRINDVSVGMLGNMTDLKKAITYGLKRMIGLTVEDVIELARTRSEEHILDVIKKSKGSFFFDKDSVKRLATAKLSKKVIAEMRKKKKRTQILILLTDGEHTATPGSEGREEVIQAAKHAAMFKVKIYTIGVGSKNEVAYACFPASAHSPYPKIQRVRNGSFDEPLLRKVATLTGGKFFSATNKRGLKQVYKDISTLEPNRFKVHRWDDTNELYLYFLLPMLLLFGLEFLLKETIFGSVVA